MVLVKNKKFGSFSDIEKAVSDYEQQNFVQLYKRNTRTIAVYAKRCPNRNLLEKANKALKYAEIDLCCNHGGRDNFKSRGTGQRPNTQ